MSAEPEFSRTVSIAHIRHGEVVQKIEADEAERTAMTARLRLENISSLVGEFVLRHSEHTSLYEVEGEAWATITQICVASGDAFDTEVQATIRALYSEEPGLAIDLGASNDQSWDDVEPVVNGEIDIGELAVQHLSLALDPYPRKPGYEFANDEPAQKSTSPFALLKGLIKGE